MHSIFSIYSLYETFYSGCLIWLHFQAVEIRLYHFSHMKNVRVQYFFVLSGIYEFTHVFPYVSIENCCTLICGKNVAVLFETLEKTAFILRTTLNKNIYKTVINACRYFKDWWWYQLASSISNYRLRSIRNAEWWIQVVQVSSVCVRLSIQV